MLELVQVHCMQGLESVQNKQEQLQVNYMKGQLWMEIHRSWKPVQLEIHMCLMKLQQENHMN